MRQLVLDTEIYVNYFLLAFKDIETGKSKSYEIYDGSDPFPADEVMRIMRGCETISFNGLKFDLPLITLACKGWDAIKGAWIMELFEKFALFVVIALNNKQEECSSQGKVAVRSIFWYECVPR